MCLESVGLLQTKSALGIQRVPQLTVLEHSLIVERLKELCHSPPVNGVS